MFIYINQCSYFKIFEAPLHNAVKSGNLEIIKFLCSLDADVTIVDANGNTVLHLAALYGYKNIFDFIVSLKKIDINSKNKVNLYKIMFI